MKLSEITTRTELEQLDINTIILDSEKLYASLINRYCAFGIEYDALMQICRLATLHAYENYNGKSAFFSWMYKVIVAKLNQILKARYTDKGQHELNLLRLDGRKIDGDEVSLKNSIRCKSDLPYDNLLKIDMHEAITGLIHHYCFADRIDFHKKKHGTYELLVDYFVFNLHAKEMIELYGERYDNRVSVFRRWVQKNVKDVKIRSMDKRHVNKLNKKIKMFKSNEIEKRKHIKHERSTKALWTI